MTNAQRPSDGLEPPPRHHLAGEALKVAQRATGGRRPGLKSGARVRTERGEAPYPTLSEKRRRANARRSSAKQAAQRHKREPTIIDWDKAVAHLKTMLNEMYSDDEKRTNK